MIQRREFLAGLTAVLVSGFDPTTRRWVSEARAAHPDLHHIPHLDGELVFDPATLAQYATDAGNLIEQVPVAVLRPGSVEDVAKMIRFSRKHRIFVAARGQGHTTFGQSLVEGGLIIDMAPLSQIHSIGSHSTEVGAGALWRDLLGATLTQGLTPPALTGYIGLSIGGTLSVGGISAGNRRGAQVDHVRRLEVVTGKGDVVECSHHHHRDLFEGVLAGLGQLGVITRAEIELSPAPAQARVYQLNYVDNATFFSDLRLLLDEGRFDDLFNLWVPDGGGGWIYSLNAVSFFNPGSPPDDAALLAGLSYDPGSFAVESSSYLDYALRVDVVVEFFKGVGLWQNTLHPWFDVFLPDASVEQYVGDVIPTLSPEDVGMTGFLLLFPLLRSKLKKPLLRVPDDEWVYLFDILTAAGTPGPDPAFAAEMLARNRELFEKARDAGGTRYPIGSVEFTHRDWKRHYGQEFREFLRLKHRYDPAGILAPGVGIH